MSTTVIQPLPTSFTFRAFQQNQITWQLTDQNQNPITGATVTATLYANRSISNPIGFPGVIADPANLNNLALAETIPGTSGIYVGATNALLNPTQATTGYVLVISALNGSVSIGTWSIPAVDLQAQTMNDLVQMDQVKDWLGIPFTNTDDDGTIQFLISAFSQYVLNKTGVSSFTSVQQYNEIYDGNGATRMFVNNTPIQSLISLTIGAFSPPVSTSTVYPGIYIELSKKSIAFRAQAGSFYPPSAIYPYFFLQGQGNIQIVYTAGFSSVPFDLGEACMAAVAINYKRKDYIDLASRSLSAGGGSGTTTYRNWGLPPEINEVIEFYSRYARP